LDVLIFRPGAIGDTLLLLPSLVYLAGKAHFTVVCRKPGLNFIRGFVNQTMDFEGPGWYRLFLKTPSNEGLPVRTADLVVAFLHDEDGLIRRNLEAHFPYSPIHFFSSTPPAGEALHVVRYLSECLKAAGLPIDPKIALDNALKHPTLTPEPPSGSRSMLVIHPGSGSLTKNHPPEFWLRLLDILVQASEFRNLIPAVLLGPAERPLEAFFKKNLGLIKGELYSCLEKKPLTDLLEKASVYVGHDSGITHFSAMLGVPTVALFRRNNAEQWAPLGPLVRVIQSRNSNPGLVDSILKAAKDLRINLLHRSFALS
jgi:heptosyltransferase III